MKTIQKICFCFAVVILFAANANAGRWLTRDPIGFMERDPRPHLNEQINLYRFVDNNPVSKVDPSGLLPDEFFVYRNELKDFPAVSPPPSNPADAAKSMVGAPNWNIFWPSPLNWFDKPKCNKFVGDMISATPSMPAPLVNGRYPTADEWTDPSVNIPGYGSPHSPPLPGDVVSEGGHTGFFDNDGTGYTEAPTYGEWPSFGVKDLPTNNNLWNPSTGRSPIK